MTPTSEATERLHLTEYEIQVLLGTSVHGCNMSPDRVFSLPMAWHRLHAIGLIDRSDGLAIITEKGRGVVDRIVAMLASAPASPAIGVQAVNDEMRAAHVKQELADVEASLDDAIHYLVDLAGAKPSPMTPHNVRIHLDHARMSARRLAEAASAGAAGIDEATMGRRWRVFEAIQHGWWGIEIDGDEEPLLYPIKTARETLSRLVDIHNTALSTPSDTAPSPKGVSDGVREAAKEALRVLCQTPDSRRSNAHKNAIGKLRAALSQEHAPGRKESQS